MIKYLHSIGSNKYFIFQPIDKLVDKDEILNILKQFDVQIFKFEIYTNYFYLCVDIHPKYTAYNVVNEIKTKLNLEKEPYYQTVSDFNNIEKAVKVLKKRL